MDKNSEGAKWRIGVSEKIWTLFGTYSYFGLILPARVNRFHPKQRHGSARWISILTKRRQNSLRQWPGFLGKSKTSHDFR